MHGAVLQRCDGGRDAKTRVASWSAPRPGRFWCVKSAYQMGCRSGGGGPRSRLALGIIHSIPWASMSKPLSRRSRDFFAGVPHIYSASPGSGRQESTYEPAPVTITKSPGLSPQERRPDTAASPACGLRPVLRSRLPVLRSKSVWIRVHPCLHCLWVLGERTFWLHLRRGDI